ncbi:MAG: hypothetical protein J0L73_01815 [Verrucomicrobia bacterium]|nr:hypothetical protein [Verrucomicrobiota bacterium]
MSKRRRLWRWTWRLTLLGTLLLAILLYIAWQQRVPLVNALLRRFSGDTQVQIVSLDWQDGTLRVGEVSTLHVPSSQRTTTVGHVEWRPNWSQLSKGNLGGLKVADAVVDVPLSWLLPSPAKPGDPSSKPSTRRWHLDLIDLAPTKFVLRDSNWLPVGSIIITQKLHALEIGGSKSPSFQTVTTDLQDAEWHGHPLFKSVHLESVMHGDDIDLKKISLQGGSFDLDWLKEFSPGLHAKLPALRGSTQIEWEARDAKLSRSGITAFGTHEIHLKNLHLQPLTAAGQITAPALDLKASQDTAGLWHIQSGLLQKPVIDWTPELENALFPKSKSGQPSSSWQVQIDALEVQDAALKLSSTDRNPVAGSLTFSTHLKSLPLSPAGVRSAARQKLTLADLSLRWGRIADSRPFVQIKSATLEAVPDKLRENWQVDSLAITEPRLEFTPENGPWFNHDKTPPPNPPPAPAIPWWKQLQFGTLTLQDGTIDFVMQLAERTETSIQFGITTEQSKQHLHIPQAQVRIPRRANLPVLSFEKVEAVASLPDLWRQQRFESLKLTGGQIEVGDALMTLFSNDNENKAPQAKPTAPSARWITEKIAVEKLGITLTSIAPGLPPVRFDVNFAAGQTPLDVKGLAENVEPQTILLTHLRIPSPYEPLRTVAEMDKIQVTYTLDGLLQRRIDRVEIASPLLYVGEDLFWYVETYRKSMKGEAPVADATFGPPAPPKPATPAWHVDTLAVTDGRLILAPKGVPLKGFSKPFPFSFTSKLTSGQLDAVFDIPSDNYTLEQFELEFRGMKGHVRFNLPLKDRDNNLTETFTVEQLRYKQLHIEKAHLSVTYDANGIYGIFGGAAYSGYVNGAFDIYLDDVYTWDGWVAGEKVDLGPVTTVMFPSYFLLNGKVAGKIIATGNKNELYQADGEFTNRSRGKFSIASLNDVINAMPKALTGTIGDQINRIGLETLRDFEYDSVDGRARFYGREGRGHLRFIGPYGARKIDINVYDHRWKEDPRKAKTADAVE